MSFTCTLFAPTAEFETLDSREAILVWFRRYFPDAFALIGEHNLIEDFERSPRSPLISIKVRKGDQYLILLNPATSCVYAGESISLQGPRTHPW